MNICRKWFEDADREFVQAVQNVMTASTGDDVAMMKHSTERDMWKCRWEEFRHEMNKLSMLAEIRHAAKHAAQIEAQISTEPVVVRFDSVEQWLAHKPAPVVCNDPKHAYSVDLQQSIHGPTTVRISVGGVLRHACSHPSKRFSETEPDDYVYLGDDEIDGKAPGPGRTVGIAEGGDIKPSDGPLLSGLHMNKWCTRECERSAMSEGGEPFTLPDLKTPRPNMPWLHPATQAPGPDTTGEKR